MADKIIFKIKRETLADILGQMNKALKPKAKDAILRRVVLFGFSGGDASLFATNETLFMSFKAIEYEAIEGDVVSFAADLVKLNWAANANKSDYMEFVLDVSKDRLMVIVGSTKAEIGLLDSGTYQEYMGSETPDDYPVDIGLYTEITGLDEFYSLSGFLLSCTSPKLAHLAGVFTDGNGTFMSTNMFKGMQIILEDHKWGFRALIPSDFFALLESIGDSAYIYWVDSRLWLRNEDASIVVSGFTKEAEKFPVDPLGEFFVEMETDCDKHVILDSTALRAALERVKGFFGDSVVTEVTFKNRMGIKGEGKNKDKLRDSVPYKLADGSAPVDDFSFRMMLDVIEELPTIFEDEFTLHMTSNNQPMYTEAENLGIKLLLTPYFRRD